MFALSIAAVLFVGIIYYSRPRTRSIVITSIDDEKLIKPRKILTLATERIDQN